MSKLIKKEENPLFQLESFEAAEISQNQGNRSLGNGTGSVRVPLAGNLRDGEDPKEKRARLEKEAYEKGFEQGRKDGLALEKRQMEEKGKPIYPNVDFFSGAVYSLLGIRSILFTPIFAMSRVAGWLSHILEQRVDNRLYRPKALYNGHEEREFVPIAARS